MQKAPIYHSRPRQLDKFKLAGSYFTNGGKARTQKLVGPEHLCVLRGHLVYFVTTSGYNHHEENNKECKAIAFDHLM